MDDLDYVELTTEDGRLGFKLHFNGVDITELNVTEAYEPEEQKTAIKELRNIFGKDKLKLK